MAPIISVNFLFGGIKKFIIGQFYVYSNLNRKILVALDTLKNNDPSKHSQTSQINHLLEHGVGVIIVTDGRAPHLKALTIARRLGITLDCNNKVGKN